MTAEEWLLKRWPTPLRHARALGERLGLGHLYLKLAGATPTGNHKWHMAQAACGAFLSRSRSRLVLASCGHYGTSIAFIAGRLDIPTKVYLPAGADVPTPSSTVEIDFQATTYGEAVTLAAGFANDNEGVLDATPGAELKGHLIASFAPLAMEIVNSLGRAPDVLLCPVGNGTTLAGFYSGFRAFDPQHLPRFIGAGMAENSLFAETATAPVVPIEWDIEPLVASEPTEAREVMEATRASSGHLVAVSKQQLHDALAELTDLAGLAAHPSSAAPIAAIRELLRRAEISGDMSVVVIITTSQVPAV